MPSYSHCSENRANPLQILLLDGTIQRMRIIVAGGAGFLGSHLVDKLLSQDNEVIVLDNLYTGSKANIQEHLSNPLFEFINHDITEPFNVEADQIYNLACPASPVQYQKHPVQTIKTSVLGSINILDLADRTNARVLQASTSEVYGDPNVSPQNELYLGNVNPIGIRACYDEGKRASETLFFDYHRQYGVKIKVARIFNTYGPRMDLEDGRVVSNFIVQALKNENITIYGDGKQTRSFCYVDDLITGLVSLMNSPEIVTGPINIGNPNEFTMLELAETVIKLSNSQSKLEYQPLPSDDPKQRKPDITRAKESLSWVPTIELEEGLLKTIEEFKGRL
jgi:UDP-glucuronate decarboxylase